MHLHAGDLRGQTGAIRWAKVRTVVISDDAGQRKRLATRRNMAVVATPLELVFALEDHDPAIATVVLAGRFRGDHALVSFLSEDYPQVGVHWLGVEPN